MQTFNVIAGIVSIIAFGLAIWQTLEARRMKQLERERLDSQLRRNRSVLKSAVTGAQTADLIVQRAKENNVTVHELQSLARAIRGSLLFLASELDDQHSVLKAWRFGRDLTQSHLSEDDEQVEQTGPNAESALPRG